MGNKNLKTKTGKRNTGVFYALLKQQPGYDSRYSDVIKEGIVENFTFISRAGRSTRSLSDLSDREYSRLIEEMKESAGKQIDIEKAVEEKTRRKLISDILRKLGTIGITTIAGYADVNSFIEGLKGSKGRIYKYKTEELPDLFRAVCNAVDFYKKKQKEIQRIQIMN